MTDFTGILETLAAGDVDFILVGGVAAIAHGSARLTQDIDVVYDRTDENLERLVEALAPYEPYLRGAPPGLPFQLAAGRPKDLEATAELEAILDERDSSPT